MQYTMHIAQRYDSDQVVFSRHRARADAALNSPLIAPGFSLLSYVCAVATTKNDKHGLQTGSGVWCKNVRQNAWTLLTFQQKSDNFNLALQTVPFSIMKNISLFFTSTHGLCGRVHIHLLLLWFRFRFTPIISPSSLIETDYVNLTRLKRFHLTRHFKTFNSTHYKILQDIALHYNTSRDIHKTL